MLDYAQENGVQQDVIERLEILQAAAATLVHDGPDAIADYVKAVINDPDKLRAFWDEWQRREDEQQAATQQFIDEYKERRRWEKFKGTAIETELV